MGFGFWRESKNTVGIVWIASESPGAFKVHKDGLRFLRGGSGVAVRGESQEDSGHSQQGQRGTKQVFHFCPSRKGTAHHTPCLRISCSVANDDRCSAGTDLRTGLDLVVGCDRGDQGQENPGQDK